MNQQQAWIARAFDYIGAAMAPRPRKLRVPKPRSARTPRPPKLRPFLAIDGEGCGRNRHGQQHYRLLTASDGTFTSTLCTGRPLTTRQMLEWICRLPAGPILVGFSFGYDASQILRDLPPDRLSNAAGKGLFDDKQPKPGEPFQGMSRYTWHDDFGLEYLPRNYLRVCRVRRVRKADGTFTKQTVPGSARTIYDTFGFFQMSFLKALEAFSIGTADEWVTIERNKKLRDEFTRITREIRRYNELECRLLVQLMQRFREVCHDAGLRPRTWNGAGKLAAVLHDTHGTVSAAEVKRLVPDGVLAMADSAYYGGRFEVMRVGKIDCPVWEYDIRSAYPAAMRDLPCLLHGTWEMFTGKPPARSLHVAYVAFDHPADVPLCGLPVRHRDGYLYWPRQGQGSYWSCELAAARRLGATIRYTGGWRYVWHCQCRPFDWIEPLFQARLALGKDARGYPIKLGLNSLYGKLAQRIGNPRWHNLVWAGLITATTRAQLVDAARHDPAAVVMMATDALFSLKPLPLQVGDQLGQWEVSDPPHPAMFICQPGVYWGAKRPKTRGIPVAELTKHTALFERRWQSWCDEQQMFRQMVPDLTTEHLMVDMMERGKFPFPSVKIEVPSFIGLRLAYARGKLETACRWTKGEDSLREYSFAWVKKRTGLAWVSDQCVQTRPRAGGPDLVSVTHAGNAAWSGLNEQRMVWDDQPDLVDLAPPDR